jgi:GT2 family glycosyltransferase
LTARDLDQALRVTDRLWRHASEDVDIAGLYARLLLRMGDHDAARRILAEAAERRPDPEIEASLVEALIAADAIEAAAQRLAAALRRFCLAPDGALAAAARRLIARPGPGLRGWVGVTAGLDLTGEVIGAGRHGRLELRSPADERLAQVAIADPPAGPALFHLAPPPEGAGPLTVLVNGSPLLGSPISCRRDFDLDGRATTQGSRVTGWVKLGWLPSRPVDLVITDERGGRADIAAPTTTASPGPQRLDFRPRDKGLTGNQIFISAVLPDGSMQQLPDAPLLLEQAVPPFKAPARPHRRSDPRPAARPHRPPVAIVMPVYLGRDETLAALAALVRTRRPGDEVIVVDDASPDPALSAELDALAARTSITLLRNDANLGFSASVNRGLAVHATRDAILLNADAVVHGDWIDRLQAAAYSSAGIGTATPLTNNGAIASYPGGEEQECSADAAAALDVLAAGANAGATVDLPVGVGFCLYIRRDCLAATGDFDAATFGKGYGEDNDFCMRARKHGWRHVLAADVFVRHAGGRSFGRRGHPLRERNARLLNLRHPGYDALVAKFLAADPARPVRRRLDEARLRQAGGRYVLIVTLALPGGVARFVAERCRALRARGVTPLLLQPAAGGCALSSDDGHYRDLCYAVPGELAAMTALLAAIAIEHVELHHFLGFDGSVIDAVLALDAPHDVYIHDYVWICPRVSLIGGAGRYCGEPSLAVCARCVRHNGSALTEAIAPKDLRRRSARWLGAARAVIAPCTDVASRITRHFPGLEPRIEPWQEEPARNVAPPPRSDVTRIAIIGAIGEQKGYGVLLACAREAAAHNRPLEFVVIGHTEADEALIATGKVFITGRYDEPELAGLLRRERPHLVFFPSVTPETWCYTLTEAMSAGVPIVAFDLGAIAERLRNAGTGILIPLSADPVRLNQRLMSAAADSRPIGAAASAPPSPPDPTDSRAQETQHMNTSAPVDSKPNAITGSVEAITIAKGRYVFSVRSGAPSQIKEAGNLIVPAVHVGLGPGISPKHVKFSPSADADGTWLFAAGSTLEVKILSAAATLVLTSVRAPGGQPLVIDADRLDAGNKTTALARAKSPTPPPPAAADKRPSLRAQIVAHIRYRGDMAFVDVPWAGRVGPGLWIEAFAVKPLEKITDADIEYKGLTRTGIETPWISNGAQCGTRGMSVPLIGFAARLKPSAGTGYECEYSGCFQSGAVVGPLRNGAPCRSSAPNDVLEGIQIRIVERTGATAAAAPARPAPRVAKPTRGKPSRQKAAAAAKPRKPAAAARPKSGTAGRKPAPPRKRRAAHAIGRAGAAPAA